MLVITADSLGDKFKEDEEDRQGLQEDRGLRCQRVEGARPKSSQPIFLSVGMGGERWNSTDLLGRLANLKMWEP